MDTLRRNSIFISILLLFSSCDDLSEKYAEGDTYCNLHQFSERPIYVTFKSHQVYSYNDSVSIYVIDLNDSVVKKELVGFNDISRELKFYYLQLYITDTIKNGYKITLDFPGEKYFIDSFTYVSKVVGSGINTYKVDGCLYDRIRVNGQWHQVTGLNELILDLQ